jgi:hypothetical protein
MIPKSGNRFPEKIMLQKIGIAMRAAIIVLAIILTVAIATPALAQEPVGCDKFKWPLDRERAMLTAADVATVPSGASVAQPPPVAVTVALVPLPDAKLPMPPERAPKSPDSFAGFVQIPAPASGTYKISLSSASWIDVIQTGQFVKETGFTGATGCDGVRKSVKFNLAAQPFTVQFSGVTAKSIRIAITGN